MIDYSTIKFYKAPLSIITPPKSKAIFVRCISFYIWFYCFCSTSIKNLCLYINLEKN